MTGLKLIGDRTYVVKCGSKFRLGGGHLLTQECGPHLERVFDLLRSVRCVHFS